MKASDWLPGADGDFPVDGFGLDESKRIAIRPSVPREARHGK